MTLIRRKKAAEMLGVSISTLKRMIKRDPSFPAPWKRKRTVRFKQEDIERYMENKVQKSQVS